MKTTILALIAVVIVSGCASWQPPRTPGVHYFCKPDSAIRYRGTATVESVVIRPADKAGTCRHQ